MSRRRLTLAARAACAALVLTLAAPLPAQPAPAKPHPVHAFFLEGIEAFNRHDLEPFMRQFGDDLEMFAADVGWLRGKAAVRERFTSTLARFPHVRMTIRNLRVREITKDVVVCDYEFDTYPTGAGPAYHGMGTGTYVRRAGRWEEVQEHETVLRIDPELRRP